MLRKVSFSIALVIVIALLSLSLFGLTPLAYGIGGLVVAGIYGAIIGRGKATRAP